ncbi:MAG: hypothetical protein ABL962_01345, partial [Fimbriimonadaceae bacterium]
MAKMKCKTCGGTELYVRYGVPSSSMYGPQYLRGIGFWATPAHFDIIVGERCGLSECFVEQPAR